MQGTGNINELFPEILFKSQVIREGQNSTHVTYECPAPPHFSQKWVSSFGVIGDPYIIPPFENFVFLNDISKMFAVSFIFGTISRYYPTTWNNITNGIKDDSVLPYAINLMDFLQEKYPQVIMDFINSPYTFENNEL